MYLKFNDNYFFFQIFSLFVDFYIIVSVDRAGKYIYIYFRNLFSKIYRYDIVVNGNEINTYRGNK